MGLEAPGGIKTKLAMIVVAEVQADPIGVENDERNLLRAASGIWNALQNVWCCEEERKEEKRSSHAAHL